MDYSSLLDTIMSTNKDIRFSLVSDMYGNVVTCRHREGEQNLLSDEETRDSLRYSAEAWKVRNEHAKKIGRGKYAFVEYEKISRITLLLSEDRFLLITADRKDNSIDIIKPILNKISNPKP